MGRKKKSASGARRVRSRASRAGRVGAERAESEFFFALAKFPMFSGKFEI